MNITEIRALDDGDLQVQVDKCRRDLFNLRVKATTESLDNPMQIRGLKKTIARMLTEQRKRAMAGSAKS